uniref:Uncharacterized protein n=1 Tax=Fagus sylvatica TaxID=28930 RepID=A0A2N9F7P4_FAGSY
MFMRLKKDETGRAKGSEMLIVRWRSKKVLIRSLIRNGWTWNTIDGMGSSENSLSPKGSLGMRIDEQFHRNIEYVQMHVGTTRVTEGARRVTWPDDVLVLQAARPASYGGYFIASESSKRVFWRSQRPKSQRSTVGQWLTWQNSTVVNGADVSVDLLLTWRYERTTRVTEGARRVTWPDDVLVLQAARPASYGGYFIASESSKRVFWRSQRSTVGQWLTWQNSTVVNGADVSVDLLLTWRYERTTRVTEGARRVTWPNDVLVLQAARPASYVGYFIASESNKQRVHRNSDGGGGAKLEMVEARTRLEFVMFMRLKKDETGRAKGSEMLIVRWRSKKVLIRSLIRNGWAWNTIDGMGSSENNFSPKGLTWRYERTTRVTEGARHVTWPDDVWLQAARPASYGGYFCSSKSSKVRPFKWWWRCSERRLVPKILMKAPSLLAMYSTFDSSGYTGILTAAADQYQRWLRQRKNARKGKDCTKHIEQWL